ncbi:MAG: aldehyde dehydrogenase family protein [Trebonia sp.]
MCRDEAAVRAEEQFGPALPIIRYTDLEQAVEWANGVEGLKAVSVPQVISG